MHVEQPRKHLVHRIERRPRPVQIEPARLDLAAHDFGEDLFTVDDRPVLPLAPQRADITGPALRLRPCQFGDDIVGARAALRIAGLRVHQHERSQIMAERMAGDRVAFPPAIDWRLCGQPGIDHEIVQKPIRAQPQQVRAIDLDCGCMGRRQQPHRRQRQRFRSGRQRSRSLAKRVFAHRQQRHRRRPHQYIPAACKHRYPHSDIVYYTSDRAEQVSPSTLQKSREKRVTRFTCCLHAIPR